MSQPIEWRINKNANGTVELAFNWLAKDEAAQMLLLLAKLQTSRRK